MNYFTVFSNKEIIEIFEMSSAANPFFIAAIVILFFTFVCCLSYVVQNYKTSGSWKTASYEEIFSLIFFLILLLFSLPIHIKFVHDLKKNNFITEQIVKPKTNMEISKLKEEICKTWPENYKIRTGEFVDFDKINGELEKLKARDVIKKGKTTYCGQ